MGGDVERRHQTPRQMDSVAQNSAASRTIKARGEAGAGS